MSRMTGDFIGFTYNGVHSSDLGIVRVSDGSRFNENLLPTIQDKTVQVPGGDGTYYFGTYYTQKQFNISFAFDSMTEEQFRDLREIFGDKNLHSLIFDEAPYKEYLAKVTGTATMKYICFDEKNERIYKGEGSIVFTAYQPYAKSTFKFLDKPYYKVDLKRKFYKPNTYYKKVKEEFELVDAEEFQKGLEYYALADNIEEWDIASGMRQTKHYIEANTQSSLIDTFIAKNNGFYVYNPGDIEADFIIRIWFNGGNLASSKLYLEEDSGELLLSEITPKNADAGIQINTKLNLIEGIGLTGNKTGTLYNECLIGGSFFKIPKISSQEDIQILYLEMNGSSNHNPEIVYDYHYF